MKKGILLSLLCLIMVGCNGFSTEGPKKGTEDQEVIPFFRTDQKECETTVAHFIPWHDFQTLGVTFIDSDTVTLSVVKVEGNTTYFKERVVQAVFCIASTDHVHNEFCGNGTGKVERENFFSFTAKDDTLFFEGESQLFSCFSFSPVIPLKKPSTTLDSIDLTKSLFPVAQAFDNSFGKAKEVILGSNRYANATVLCDATPTYIDGAGHCLVFDGLNLVATASFGIDMMSGGTFPQNGYIRIE